MAEVDEEIKMLLMKTLTLAKVQGFDFLEDESIEFWYKDYRVNLTFKAKKDTRRNLG